MQEVALSISMIWQRSDCTVLIGQAFMVRLDEQPTDDCTGLVMPQRKTRPETCVLGAGVVGSLVVGTLLTCVAFWCLIAACITGFMCAGVGFGVCSHRGPSLGHHHIRTSIMLNSPSHQPLS